MSKEQLNRPEYLSYLSAWLSVSYLLSMDIVVPLYEEMGLVLPNSSLLPESFRDGVLKIKKQGGVDDLIIADFKKQLSANFGEQHRQQFLVWFSTIYRNSPGWAEWRLFCEVKYAPGHREKLKNTASIDDRQISLLEEYCNHCFDWENNDGDPTTRLLKDLRVRSLNYLSLWDSTFMRENNFTFKISDVNDVSEETDVFADAINAISMNRFQTDWEKLWSHFTNKQKHKIVEMGESLLNVKLDRAELSKDLPAIAHYFPSPSYLLTHPDVLIRYAC